jgi:hypothetical protein
MSRATKLTSGIAQAIAEDIQTGLPFGTACLKNGVSEGTGRGWLARGRGTSARKKHKIYEDFAVLVEEAEAEFESHYLSIIAQAAGGQNTVKTKTVTIYRSFSEEGLSEEGDDPGCEVRESDGSARSEGKIIRKEVTTIEEPPNWLPARWMLERKYPHRYGNNRMSEMEAVRILIDANWLPDAVVESLVVGGENFESHMQNSLKLAGSIDEANSVSTGIMPNPMQALDVLIQQGWFPRAIRTRLIRTSPSDRVRVAQEAFAAWAAQRVAETDGDDEDDDDEDDD